MAHTLVAINPHAVARRNRIPVERVPAWFRGSGFRPTKFPNLFVYDCGDPLAVLYPDEVGRVSTVETLANLNPPRRRRGEAL